MVIDAEKKTLRIPIEWRLPYNYEGALAAHLRPNTGLSNNTVLNEIVN
jgi:hypothetical protein